MTAAVIVAQHDSVIAAAAHSEHDAGYAAVLVVAAHLELDSEVYGDVAVVAAYFELVADVCSVANAVAVVSSVLAVEEYVLDTVDAGKFACVRVVVAHNEVVVTEQAAVVDIAVAVLKNQHS